MYYYCVLSSPVDKLSGVYDKDSPFISLFLLLLPALCLCAWEDQIVGEGMGMHFIIFSCALFISVQHQEIFNQLIGSWCSHRILSFQVEGGICNATVIDK